MSVDDWGEPSPRVSFLALPRTHTPGHFQPSNSPERRHADDRFL